MQDPKKPSKKTDFPEQAAKQQNLPSVQDSAIVIRRIRVRKEDSAFIYATLESYEGIASYSTVDYRPGEAHRDLELQIPVDFLEDVERLLKELGEMVYELK